MAAIFVTIVIKTAFVLTMATMILPLIGGQPKWLGSFRKLKGALIIRQNLRYEPDCP